MSKIPGMGNRRYLRYEILDYALVQPTDAPQPINAVIVNIGLGGAQLRSKQPLPLGQICKLKVGRNGDRLLELRGEVRHCSALEDSDLYASGFQFVPDNHRERMDIAEYVHEVFQRQCDRLII